ncbi:L-fucose:H+ symporter permease [Cutibacterium avidum]|uniref:L-fucose:H+ symporter permease n=1 Tax=Cutibacterium avidum TaxID=33010 RepID=UPI0020963347|nr:L-fucose:H+ symporter permease [Cutibacterium avidum]MCO6660030.1 L-fucose:H+ symporter permease [Cutibacterium avidum]
MLIKHSTVQQDDGYLDRTPIFQYILLSICFPLWGAAASLNDILITQFKTIFTLSDAASAFVQSAFYGGYFVIAIPASRVIKKWSYKLSILIGLTLYIVGCMLFFPASHMATYSVFLVALFAIAVGLSFLETSCNTYSSMIGPKKSSTLRLNISQTFYPLGSIFGILLGKYLIFSEGDRLQGRMSGLDAEKKRALAEEMLARTLLPYKYIVMVLVVMLILVAITQFPHCKPLRHTNSGEDQEASASIGETLRYLVRNKTFCRGVFVQFLYVGLQTALWSFTIRLALSIDQTMNERTASNFMIWAFIAFFLGKFLANVLMTRIGPNKTIIIYSTLGCLALLYVMLVPNMSAVWAAILTSGLLGPCWATIYTRTLDAITDKRHTETGGAVIVMSIVGGAVVPLLQGMVSDRTGSMPFSFVVPLACFAAVLTHFILLQRSDSAAVAD